MIWTGWNARSETELRRLWSDGYSASVIAAMFGVTRNTILGKTGRLGLPGEHGVVNPSGHVRSKRKIVKVEKVKIEKLAPPIVVVKKKKLVRPVSGRTRSELYAMLAEAVRNTR